MSTPPVTVPVLGASPGTAVEIAPGKKVVPLPATAVPTPAVPAPPPSVSDQIPATAGTAGDPARDSNAS